MRSIKGSNVQVLDMKSMLNVGTCVGIREDIVYAGFRDGKMVGV